MNKHQKAREQRRREILQLLDQHGYVMVEQLSRHFGVSDVTIRTDLEHFAELELVIRIHGGAKLAPATERELPLAARMQQRPHAKMAIGRMAARLIHDGATIVLDSSSTSLAIVPYVSRRHNVCVVTNSMAVARALGECPQFQVIIPGGRMRHESESIVELHAQSIPPGTQADIGFFGAHGISITEGLIEISPEEAAAKRVMHALCRQSVALLDSSKLNRFGSIPFIPLAEVHTLISDSEADQQVLRDLRMHGVHCFIATVDTPTAH